MKRALSLILGLVLLLPLTVTLRPKPYTWSSVPTFTFSEALAQISNPVCGGSADLSWTPPTQTTTGEPLTGVNTLTGFNVYAGTDPTVLTDTVSLGVGSLNYIWDGLCDGTYYFAATAINAQGESMFSNVGVKEVTGFPFPVEPGVPEAMVLTVQ